MERDGHSAMLHGRPSYPALTIQREKMAGNFQDISEAFEFVSFGSMYEHQAFLDKETGKVYYHSDFDDDEEELPEDIDDEK